VLEIHVHSGEPMRAPSNTSAARTTIATVTPTRLEVPEGDYFVDFDLLG